jgi:hypothetical protein
VNHQNLSSFIWSVADLLRGDYKQSDYGNVILPFTVLRRLDCVLEPTKAKVLVEFAAKKKAGLNPDPFLLRASGQSFYNTSDMDLRKLMGDQDHISQNLYAYVQGFSPAVRDIFERFSFSTQIDKLAKSGLLYLVTEKFAGIDLHPEAVDNHEMGLAFEELIRKFAELSNETAGEHFTPREVIRLMVNLLFVEDNDVLSKPGVVRTIFDPTAGTGGMLSVAGEHLAALNPQARLTMFGQELNDESYAICKADMLIKGQDVANIVAGNTLSEDGHAHAKFDYMLSNPPFGVEWKKVETSRMQYQQTQFGFAVDDLAQHFLRDAIDPVQVLDKQNHHRKATALPASGATMRVCVYARGIGGGPQSRLQHDRKAAARHHPDGHRGLFQHDGQADGRRGTSCCGRCADARQHGEDRHRTRKGLGTYGPADYMKRAVVAAFGWPANNERDAVYPYTEIDSTGKTLTGANKYRLTFAKDATPPVGGFWSITARAGPWRPGFPVRGDHGFRWMTTTCSG